MRLAIVTASTHLGRAASCIDSWFHHHTTDRITVEIVSNGNRDQPYLGTVPAFRVGVDKVLQETDADVIACLHDDLEIDEAGWDEKVLLQFDRHPKCGLLGFGGATGLGASDMYLKDYDPMSLARVGFRSNMREAEVHGMRSLLPERVACLDGFSQIGRRAFWEGKTTAGQVVGPRPWTMLEQLGLIHHIYDGALGCLAKRYGWEAWYLPVRCHHYGGRTAVGDEGYQAWAKTQTEEGDQGFWKAGHWVVYNEFRDCLPLRSWHG